MLKVCWLCEYPTLLGGERSLLSTLNVLVERDYEVHCLAPPDGPLAEELRLHDVPHLPFTSFQDGQRLNQADLRERLSRRLAELRPDLLHANSLSMARLSGPVAAAMQLPSIGHLRDIVGLSRRAIDDINQHRRLLAVSDATRLFHVAQGLEAAKTHVLHNGVDLEQFRPRPPAGYLHEELQLDRDVLLIGAIGQLIQRKGWLTLAQAAELVAAQDARVHFVIVGERYSEKAEAVEYERQLREMFATGSLAPRGHFLDQRADVARLMPEFTMLVHPARQEPLGRILLEAAACGLPVVATDIGGTREIFPIAADSAVLIRPDDPRAMAAAMLDLIADPPRRQQLGQAARRRAEAAFDAGKSANRLADHYADVLNPSTSE